MPSRLCADCGRTMAEEVMSCPACGVPVQPENATDGVPLLAASVARALGGGYRVESLIGRGGYALVFQVHDERLDRRLAVKVLHPELGAIADVAERFRREARTAARLSHPNIVPTYFVGDESAVPCFAMPLVQGETLGARLAREGQLPLGVVLGIARDVASALDFAHGAGVVHRDVKPDNILLELATGRCLLTDFGVAKALLSGEGGGGSGAGTAPLLRTATGVVIGTPAYMAPEQIAGEPSIDGRADVYSLGVVVYLMLAGRLPFEGRMVEAVFAQHLEAAPPPIWTRPDDVNARAEAALRQALAKDPAQRFATAGEFVEALERSRGRPSMRRSSAMVADQASDQMKLFRTLRASVGPEALAALTGASDAPGVTEAAAAVEVDALRAAREGRVGPLLDALLAFAARSDDPRPAFRQPARDALQRLGASAEVARLLADAWKNGQAPQESIESVLVRMRPAVAAPLLAAARQEKLPELFVLADRVGALDDAAAAALARDPSVGVVFAFAAALRESARETPTLERWLAAVLRHPNAKLRVAALDVVAERGGVLAERVARLGLNDADGAVRLAAIRALGRSRRREAVPDLARMLDRANGDEPQQIAVVQALGEIGDPAVVPILARLFERRQLFRKERGEVQRSAARVLASLPPELSMSVLSSLAGDRDGEVARIARRESRRAGEA